MKLLYLVAEFYTKFHEKSVTFLGLLE